MKLLVTGGDGFIGKALVARLQAEGHEVRSYDKTSGKDLLDRQALEEQVLWCDQVFHLAAIADLYYAKAHSMETMSVNVGATMLLAELCSAFGKVLQYASTCCVYGNQEVHPETEKSMPNPSELYACSKYAAEWVINGYNRMYGLRFNHLRFATIYGPGMRSALGVHIFLGQAVRGEPITVHGDGTQTRTLTYIDDLVNGIMAVFNSGKFGEVYNLTTEEAVSATQMAEAIKELTGSASEITYIDQRPGQTMHEEISAQKARNELGWAAGVDFKEGLKRTYDWFVETNQKENVYKMPK
jgi:nucleoside-diphosphate-sugar epimerase